MQEMRDRWFARRVLLKTRCLHAQGVHVKRVWRVWRVWTSASAGRLRIGEARGRGCVDGWGVAGVPKHKHSCPASCCTTLYTCSTSFTVALFPIAVFLSSSLHPSLLRPAIAAYDHSPTPDPATQSPLRPRPLARE